MSIETYDWPTLRERAIESFGGDYPFGAQEQTVIDAFTEHPRAVAAAIDKLAEGYKQGRIRVPWAVLRKEAEGIIAEPAAVTATDTSERERAIECARSWLANAGVHFDREEEVREELFERGTNATAVQSKRTGRVASRTPLRFPVSRPTS
jgi:hypothetical protein